MIQEAIAKVVERKDLSETEMVEAMNEIMEGRTTPAQTGALLVALRMKGESVEEITGAARVMRAKALRIPPPALEQGELVVDTCGTGGDGTGTFNVSTIAAFVVAGAGVKVAKHGNRAVSSLCGSADLMEALGVSLEVSPERLADCLNQVGICFLFAPLVHSAMKHAIGPRRELGLRTIFNILGPLTNPAGATAQVMGVYDPALTTTLAEVLGRLGVPSAFVVHGEGGYDEITVTGRTKMARLANGEVTEITITPGELGLSVAQPEEIAGGDAADSAALCREILEGKPGAPRDMVLMNVAAALVAAGRAPDMKAGVGLAAGSIDSGAAMAKLKALVEASNREVT